MVYRTALFDKEKGVEFPDTSEAEDYGFAQRMVRMGLHAPPRAATLVACTGNEHPSFPLAPSSATPTSSGLWPVARAGYVYTFAQ